MSDDPMEPTVEEEQYFESRGAADIPVAPESDPVKITPEPTAEPEVKEETPRQSFVPLAALQEERRERQMLAQQLAEREKNLATLTSRFDTLQEVWQPKTPVPKYEDDPIGSINHKLEQTAKGYEELQRAEHARIAADNERAYLEQLRTVGKTQADQFAEKSPDFYDAYNSLLLAKDAELQAIGYSDPVQRRAFVTEYEVSIINKAVKDGANAAERLYALSKSLGYAPKAPAGDAGKAKLDNIAAGQSAGKSLGSATGSAPAAKLSLADVAAMSDDEFAAYTSDPGKWRNINK